MEKILPLKILAALALILLGSSVNEGRILTKCELKAELDLAFGVNMTANMTANMINNMTQCNMTVDLIAKLVCSLNRTSRFNTSVITTIQLSNSNQPQQKPIESNEDGSDEIPAPSNEDHSGEKHGGSNEGRQGERHGKSNVGRLVGKPKGRRSPRKPKGGKKQVPPTSSVVIHLLGIFQLSDRVACDSGSNQSLNICRMSCSALTDDDIMDDAECLETLITKISNTYVCANAPLYTT
ncbi:uncharacterized protein [Misgurnus anguillicaudatus]|uniref:uncharacterized protein n=1 Tax=Misgurnus anguillicaudatus TaxID=75329 RepID=UPI003CCF1C1E